MPPRPESKTLQYVETMSKATLQCHKTDHYILNHLWDAEVDWLTDLTLKSLSSQTSTVWEVSAPCRPWWNQADAPQMNISSKTQHVNGFLALWRPTPTASTQKCLHQNILCQHTLVARSLSCWQPASSLRLLSFRIIGFPPPWRIWLTVEQMLPG